MLIVDDNATNRRILEQQLAGWGLAPDSADGGRSALALLERAVESGRPYEAALIDMHMPEIGGLARTVKATPKLRSTRLIMLSSSPPRADELHTAGIEAELTKPVRSSRLYNQLVAILANDPRPAQPRRDPQPQSTAVASSGEHVLVAEDNDVNQFVAIQMLQKLGFTVDIARNGLEAIQMSARRRYTVVFMDCQMPEVDGYAATEAIRERDGNDNHTLIIAMTAHALEGDRERCLTAGMDDYPSKPLRLHAIAELLSRWPQLQPSGGELQRHIDDTVFDTAPLGEIGDSETAAAVIALFLDQATERLPQLKDAIERADTERLGRLAHSLKGGAAAVGAVRINDLCEQVCSRAAGNGMNSSAPELHQLLIDGLADTAVAMNSYIEENT